MRQSRRTWAAGAAILGLTAAGLAPLAFGGESAQAAAPSVARLDDTPSLFGEASATTARTAPDTQGRGTLVRSRYVSFRASALPSVARGQQIDLPFFSDATFRGTVSHLDKQPLLTTWSGRLDSDGGIFVVTRSAGHYQVTASTLQGSFTMNQTRSGAFQVAEVKQPTPTGEDEMTQRIATTSHRRVSAARRAADARQSPAMAASAVLAPRAALAKKGKGGGGGDDGSIEDILVAYTPAAVATYGGVPGIVAEAAKNIGYTNAAYANSGVRTTARLVGVVPTKTQGRIGNGIAKDLNSLIRRGDGRFDDVFKYVRKTHADDTMLLEAPPPADAAVCGIAALIKNQPAKYAFGVVSTGGCTDGYYSFPHELGHNQGAAHDLWTLKHSSVGHGTLDAQYRYGYGYVSPNFTFYTTMAYYEECYYVGGVICPQLLGFSNPSVSAYGETTGTKSRNNVAKLITKTRKRVARHEQSQLYLRGKLAIKPSPRFHHGRVHVVFRGWVNPGVKTKFQWYLDGQKIKHAKGRYYSPRKKDVGHQLTVVVTGKKRTYAKVVISSGARTVKGPKGKHRTTASPVVSVVRPSARLGSTGWV